MITSEQTVARIGRRMNVSTNMRLQPSGFRFDGNTVLQLLDIGDDHFLALLHTAANDVGVADEIADRDRLLPCDERATLPLLGHEDEVLATDSIDRYDRHGDGRLVRPDDAGSD